jgi:hypothetical protein
VCAGEKISKDQITVFVCSNSDGTENRRSLLLGNKKVLNNIILQHPVALFT